MMKLVLILFSISVFSLSIAQMSDSFDDGDFTNNPTWTGDVDDFRITEEKELQLFTEEEGISYLSTPHNLTNFSNKEWQFKVKYNFSPSNGNRGHTYLTAENEDLSTNPDGIFFRIGENGSNDPIELIERVNGQNTTILSSTPGIVANSFNVRVKFIYTENGDWELYTDLTGGENFQLDQTANYPISVTGSHVGICLYYTSTRSKNFWYDDFYVGDIQVDETPPSIETVYATSTTELEILFNEGIEQISGETFSNYTVNDGIGSPNSIEQNENNSGLFHLTFSTPFEIGHEYTITVSNIKDLSGNILTSQSESFVYVESQLPEFGDIIINEFIPKPSPSQGLPESQFIELYNRSNKIFNLHNWKVSDNNSTGYIGEEVWLLPGDYIVLVPSSGLEHYPNATKVTSWATLNIAGDEIHIHSAEGILVDELSYTDKWYKDDVKKGGGWSLERINPELPCSFENNWRASESPIGGTPNVINSVFDTTPDNISPSVIAVEPILPNQLMISFSEGMDSLSLAQIEFYSNDLTVENIHVEGVFPLKLKLEFTEILEPGNFYDFSLEGFKDCSGNSGEYHGSFVIPQTPVKGDLIINEILFNPLTGGSDFVEVYNNSDKYIDIKDWELANFKDGEVANNKSIDYSYIIPPHDYLVITKDSNFQIMNYPFAIPGKFVEIPSLPAYNNDESVVYLIYNHEIMDYVSYSEDWHFSLLNSKKGVSLERFSPSGDSNDPSNWHSASETMGFATPGRENSQNMSLFNEGGTLSLSSNSFSPDNDGFEDVLIISYEVSSPDLLGSLIVYDDKGRKIKTLFEQHLLGASASVKWEGTRDDGSKATIGPYIIVFDIFNLDSTKMQSVKKVVTVAGKL